MDESPAADILLVCGIPGSGKTFFAEWLERRSYGRVSVDALQGRDHAELSMLERAAIAAINGDDAPLRAQARRYAGVVIEWGFHPSDLSRLASMVDRGISAWFFDGDRSIAFEDWRTAHPGEPDQLWGEQMARLDDAGSQISAIFGANVIETISASGRRLAPEEIDQRLRDRKLDPVLRPDAEDR